jgi:hypothetical protein
MVLSAGISVTDFSSPLLATFPFCSGLADIFSAKLLFCIISVEFTIVSDVSGGCDVISTISCSLLTGISPFSVVGSSCRELAVIPRVIFLSRQHIIGMAKMSDTPTYTEKKAIKPGGVSLLERS